MTSEAVQTTPSAGAVTLQRIRPPRTLWRDALRRFRRNRLGMLGLVLVLLIVFTAIFADVLAPYPYDKADFSKVLQLPFRDPKHILGGDEVGRDFLSRLIYGARTSLMVGLTVAIVGFTIGIPLGALAGYRGGKFDFIFLRVIEVMTAFPTLLFSIFLITIWGGGLEKVILVLSISAWINVARLCRAQFLSLREMDFIGAARAIGASQMRIIFRHILPNALAPTLVVATFGVADAILIESALSFLGFGVPPPTASWGELLSQSRSYIDFAWWLASFPGIAIFITVTIYNLVGEGIRDAIDPRLKET